MRFLYDHIELGVEELPRAYRGDRLNRISGFVAPRHGAAWCWFARSDRARESLRRWARTAGQDPDAAMTSLMPAMHEVRFDARQERDVFTLYVGVVPSPPADAEGTEPALVGGDDNPRTRHARWDCYLRPSGRGGKVLPFSPEPSH